MARTISSSFSWVAACSRRWAWCSTNTMTSVTAAATVEKATSHDSGNPATTSATTNPPTTKPTAPAAAELPTTRSRRRTSRLSRDGHWTTGSISAFYRSREVFHLRRAGTGWG
jgi:hypothetical protein